MSATLQDLLDSSTSDLFDIETGIITTEVGPPDGNGDDVAFAPDGTMAWTAGLTNAIMARTPNGDIKPLVSDMPGVNSIWYTDDGRLFFTTIFAGDALYEADPTGDNPPRESEIKLPTDYRSCGKSLETMAR